ncbi:hypothetical protein CDD81_5 [Ophiocordyceps australis]|uniref:CFEM domain-containing protein n=1 Tax=Ophiocordyceps australis TaxID=1399860 RepID=A0A2C5YF88_9HYPO|nr:hypothetical protein CDD81_5 [Ophiocordyceps australis]
MARLTALLLGALSAWQIAAQDIPIPSCIPGCVNQVRTQFAEFGCTNADDAGCLCWKPNFSYGIRDCGISCGANDGNVRQQLAQAFCAGILTVQAPSATDTTSSSSTAAQSSTASSTQSSAISTSHTTLSTAVSTTAASSSSAAAAKTSSSAPSLSSPSSPATSIHSHTTTDTEPLMTASTTFDAAPEASSATAIDSPATGLSGAAAAGVGVGVGAALIALAGVGICFFMRNRKQEPRESGDISKPLPGSGRAYPPSREPGSLEKYGNDIEMTSNRYEDMVPRQQPRTMV